MREVPARSSFEDVVGLLEPRLLENRDGHVKDRDAARRPPFKTPVVRVPVEGDGGASLVQGPRKVARAEKGVYLRCLALYSSADRRVMKNGNAPVRLQSPKLVLESLGVLQALVHPGLEEILPESVGQGTVEAATETLDAREANTVYDDAGAVEEMYARLHEEVREFLRTTTLMIVVP